MKRLLLRLVVYVCMIAVIVGGIGAVGFIRSQNDYWFGIRDKPVPSLQGVKIPEHDPNKPTVAVLLGNPTTEVFDFMVPYEMFAMTEAYNVYAVAPDKNVTSLTGGLDLVPHYSFEELDQLLGKSPDLIVIPFMPMVDEEKYKPVREWIQKHSKTNLLSICSGAENLADTGLLKGKSSTLHWQVVNRAIKQHPETNWIRDQRYVVADKNIVSSAGLTSGIDAVLYVISQQLGESMAEKIAKEMNYPSYHFVKNPKVDPYYVDGSEAILYFNLAFQWNKKKTGVLLYNGMEDGALASIFDTYSASGTTKVYTISDTVQPIVTKHHLNLIARYQIANAPELDRMIVPGTEAKSLAAEAVKQWNEKGNGVEPEFMHSGSADRFIFDAPLEDLAKQEDVLTAKYGAKRLEYRANHIKLEGKPFSLEAFSTPLLLSLLAVLAAFCIDRRFIMKKTTPKTNTQAR
jgi:AraC family transcriptional activator FtrA